MSGKTSIAVLGGGSWGTALAHLLAHAGHSVALLLRDTEQAAHINAHHENPRYLRGVQLHPGIRAVAGDTGGPEQAEVLADVSILVLSVPCQAMRGTLRRLAGVVPPDCVLVNTAKGIEVSELVTVERMVREELPGFVDRYAVLSGPSFALEFRSYSSTDVPGVELGGAIKNVIAIAAGLSDGLGFGLNARAALVTRGLAETSRLGVALGARASTFMGLSGLGDLMLTCSGDLSRNRQVGLRLGSGESLEDIASSMCMVAEGVKTTQAVHRLAQRLGVDMPVTGTMYSVLYEGFAPREAVQALMGRQLKEE